MSNPFFDRPILNSPYEAPARHWELDLQGQPTQRIIERRRAADFITPIPKPKNGKATVMAMLIAWQTVNAVRRAGSKTFTKGFLVVTPGITIKDRLRVLQPNDPDSYFDYASRELIPNDLLDDIK